MIETEVLIGALIAVFLFIGTQVTKLAAPEFMNKYGRWATVLFGLSGAAISLIAYLAVNDGHIIVKSNEWEAVIVVLQELIKGFMIGIAPVGIYNFTRPIAPTMVRSSDELLVAKTPLVAAGEIAVAVPTVEKRVETMPVKSEAILGVDTSEGPVQLKAKTPKKAKK